MFHIYIYIYTFFSNYRFSLVRRRLFVQYVCAYDVLMYVFIYLFTYVVCFTLLSMGTDAGVF